MTQKPPARRGLGRGLGSLIPTAPRHDPAESAPAEHAAGEPGNGANAGTLSTPVLPEQPAGGTPTAATVGTADWIGVPLPGDPGRGATTVDTVTAEADPETPDPAGTADPAGEPLGERTESAESAAPEAGDGAESEGMRPVVGAYFAELPLDRISPNARQPREVFDEDAMAELVHSVREIGLLQPVVVRPAGAGEDGEPRFELIMGERRWRASREAGLEAIPAIVRETGDDAMLRDALLENLHRAELNALEEAAAYQQLLDDFGCTHDELAGRIGRSRPQISNTLRLLKLSPAVQRRVAAGVLSAGHARTLLGVEDAETQDRLAGRVVSEGISVRGLEEIVAVGDLGSGPRPARRGRPTSPGLDDLAARLSDRLETRVKVDLGKRKGRITVEFASLPDLERIVELLDPGHPGRTHQHID